MTAPAPWHQVTVELPRPLGGAVSKVLLAAGAAGIQEDPDAAPRQAWEPAAPPPPRLLLRAWFQALRPPDLGPALAPLLGDAPALEWVVLPETRWAEAWREGLEPVRISAELTVAPPWNAPAGALVIEPGQGFGTGWHPTTRGALRALERALAGDDRPRTLLDVGCGSGVVCLAAARRGLTAWGVDTDPAAVEEARANARRNGCAIEVSTTPIGRWTRPADLVVANHHAELLLELLPDLARLTAVELILAGILADREATIRAAVTPWADAVERGEEAGWVWLRARPRRRPVRAGS